MQIEELQEKLRNMEVLLNQERTTVAQLREELEATQRQHAETRAALEKRNPRPARG